MAAGIAHGDRESGTNEIDAILDRARSVGMNSIVTARAWGESEARIGRATGGAEYWRVMTKLDPKVHSRGLGIAETLGAVLKSLEASRDALDADVLPVVLLHHFAHRHACGGRLWRVLLAERDAGRIGSLGVSAATPEEAWAALEDPDIKILEVATSLLDLRLYRQGFFPRARELGRTVYVHSIFLQGVVFREPEALPASLRALVAPMRVIRACAKRIDVPARALFLAFVRDLPGVHPILGCESDAQFEELLADWASDAVDAATISRLMNSLPTLDGASIEPSRWSDTEPGPNATSNQTSAASVATMPT